MHLSTEHKGIIIRVIHNILKLEYVIHGIKGYAAMKENKGRSLCILTWNKLQDLNMKKGVQCTQYAPVHVKKKKDIHTFYTEPSAINLYSISHKNGNFIWFNLILLICA